MLFARMFCAMRVSLLGTVHMMKCLYFPPEEERRQAQCVFCKSKSRGERERERERREGRGERGEEDRA
jgi:hypothetical protein